MPIVIFSASIIYLLKEYIILIVFNESFLPMLELFKWALIGDVIKIASWLISYLMLAKAMTKTFIYTEVIFNCSFMILSVVMIDNYGLIGVTYAYSLNYLFYLICMIYIWKGFK